MHAFASLLAFATLILYGYRSGQMTLTVPELMARLGIGLVLGSLVIGFADQAIHHADFEWRHWLVFGALTATAAGYIGLLVGQLLNRP